MDQKTIDRNFAYHAPKNNKQVEDYQHLRDSGKLLAMVINELVPESREKSVAMTKLEEVIFWANAGIARNS